MKTITMRMYMTKNVLKIAPFISVALFLAMLTATPVLASTPTLSLSVINNSTIAVNVYGDANSPIQLYYYPYQTSYQYGAAYPYANGTFVATIGTTNSTGYFSTTLGVGDYDIPANTSIYVVVNNQQSAPVTWPTGSSGVYCPLNSAGAYPNCSGVPIAPVVPPQYPAAPAETSSLSVGINQTATVYGQSNGLYTITSNSNPSIVTAIVSGNTITFTGRQVGSATVVVCPSYGYGYPYGAYYNTTAPSCANLLVTVTPALSFSQSTIALYGVGAGQSITISDSYGYGAYPYGNSYNYGYYENFFITGDTNPNVVSASISGNALNIYAVGYGGATITVCSTSGSCGNVYVSVNSPNNYYYYNTYQYPYYQYQQPYAYSYTQPAPIYYRSPTPLGNGWYRRW